MKKWFSALGGLTMFAATVATAAELHVGFIDPAAPGVTPARNAAALAFAQTRGAVTRLQPLPGGGLRTLEGRVHAPEEFDVIWYHQGDEPGIAFTEAANSDLAAYVDGGGVMLLSGAAGKLVTEAGFEPTSPRIIGPTDAPYVSGIMVREKHRKHPIFAGLDSSKLIMLTGVGGNALADFYGTAGPHGELLAEGNAGLGERPLVEYAVGAGRVIFVGWRLADFTTARDAYRPNLERLFGNMLRYLADRNTNRARLAPPPGEATYTRLLGVPFLRGVKPAPLVAATLQARTAVTMVTEHGKQDTFEAEDVGVDEQPVAGEKVAVRALALTLLTREKPVSAFIAARKAEQEADRKREREMIGNLRIIKPVVESIKAPLKPQERPVVEQSVLFGRSPYMAPLGDITPVYEPVEDGGFRISGSRRQLNRPIVHGQNRIWTGDAPLFRMDTTAGNGCYSADRVFPLWPRPDAVGGNVYPCMGTLRIGVQGAEGETQWLDEVTDVTATFRPGYTEYGITEKRARWKATLVIAPSLDFHGFVCRVAFDRPVSLTWQYGGMWWQQGEKNANRVALQGQRAQITESNLPNGIVCLGWDGSGEGHALETGYGQQAVFRSAVPQPTFHIAGTWGVTHHDEARAKQTMARLDTLPTGGWAAMREKLKQSWFDCYIGRALQPQGHLATLLAKPDEALNATTGWWDRRRAEFQIHTPDAQLNALINFARAISEYHRQGPGLVLGAQYWVMYSHISTGWYGKEWGGDHQAMEECLRLYGAFQGDDGFIRWVSPSLVGFVAEDNTPYWVDQVWRHYTWTGDKAFVQDMWPIVRKAVTWMCKQNDPDGDGLFRDSYEYWNCDSNGKGPKAAAPSAMAWAMLDRAARIAAVVGDPAAEREYRALADRSKAAIFRELWNAQGGRLGSVGSDGLWRGHPQTWEEYLAINAGLLSPEQGRSATRWIAAHYGFEPTRGVKLLSCSDWFPIRWSVQWVPTGDTCLAALGGMKSGDADLWWPYLKTVVGSSFRSDFPGINMGIGNAGAGGGDREDVDSADPHTHVAVRGLFGIEPALHEGRLEICPAFPADWRDAEIRTPDVSYTYRQVGDRAVFRIRTSRPLVKRVRANLTGPEVVTKAETNSIVDVRLGPAIIAPRPTTPPPILAEQQPPTEQDTGKPLQSAQKARQVLFDLSSACDKTVEEFAATPFLFDFADAPSRMQDWWGNPSFTMGPTPKVVEAGNRVTFLISGRPRPGMGKTPKNLIALSSWKPYPFAAGAVVPVGLKCERLWLLLQAYVHPMKNYVPNGEVILRYADGTTAVKQLIPPFNLDAYFQHFSRQGVPVPLGAARSGGFVDIVSAHADALQIGCDPGKVLEKVELRATCSEGALGLAGMTAVKSAED